MTNQKHFNSLIDPEEVEHYESDFDWLDIVYMSAGVLFLVYIISKMI